ncbi:unnamed protein product, partial [Mesorhabditis belari]|uniref:BRCT domain-containing protein n=1 Tax=Mesorhabditis belari TaxID=2138241 RepID=A0AAF3J2R4_9BILA
MSDSEDEVIGDARQTRQQSLHVKWAESGYESTSLSLPGPDEHEEVEQDGSIIHLSGDATKPQRVGEDESTEQIIAHVVDDSGSFGRGGMFTALNRKFPMVAERYEFIAEMKDMKVGDVHLIDVSGDDEKEKKAKTTVALLIAQHADKRDEIQTELLKTCFRKLTHYALTDDRKVSVHFAKVGAGMDAFERTVEKHLCNFGVPTYVYRFAKDRQSTSHRSPQKRRHSSPVAQTGRPPRRAAARPTKRTKIVDDVFSDEDSESDISTEASDSEDEYDPDKGSEKDPDDNEGSEESSSEGSEEDSGDEEELDDDEEEEVEMKPKKNATIKRPATSSTLLTTTQTRKPSASPVKAQTSDEKMGANAFEKDVISLAEIEKKRSSDYGEFKELVEEGSGSIVEESDDDSLKTVNICVVPKSFRNNAASLASLRKQLPKGAKIVSDGWMTECTLYEKRVDLSRYIV